MIHRPRWAEWKPVELFPPLPRNGASDCIRTRCMWTWERVAKHTLNRMEKDNGRCPRIPHQGHPPWAAAGKKTVRKMRVMELEDMRQSILPDCS